jgi:hypothetical protein
MIWLLEVDSFTSARCRAAENGDELAALQLIELHSVRCQPTVERIITS